jgi:methylthioribose-1-phosphate isomerase
MSIGFDPSALEEFYKEIEQQRLLAPLWPTADGVAYRDQTRLPFEQVVLIAHSANDLAAAIQSMHIRGSGAIGCAGAFGATLAVSSAPNHPEEWAGLSAQLRAARPTAIILQKAVDEVLHAAAAQPGTAVEAAVNAAVAFFRQQLAMERAIGQWGQTLIPDGGTILTHCNSGALAGAGYGGRVLSVIRAAAEAGKHVHVIAQETRPYLQGARITAWELVQLNIPVKLATDGMAAALMQKGLVDVCVVGSDRLAANGDLVNKVGTCLIALAGREYGVPFYTATTHYNVDLACPDGRSIPIEMRPGDEVLSFNGQPVTVSGIGGIYPSFDITPASLLTGIITERGVLLPPYTPGLTALMQGGAGI